MPSNRVLVLGSRGLTHRYRHLMLDLQKLLPHHKSEHKMEKKQSITNIPEIAEDRNCNCSLYFEVRKKQDCYLWMSILPNGPSAKFHVLNVHTMEELKLTGNCLLYSRSVLHFDAAFDTDPHWRLLKEMLTHIFRSPQGHHKTKPFVDHILGFYIVDNKIWFRNFQIVDKTLTANVLSANEVALEAAESMGSEGRTDLELVEIGPRMVLNPIRIFDGAFRGATLYKNDSFVTPNQLRARLKRKFQEKYAQKLATRESKDVQEEELRLDPGELDDAFALVESSSDEVESQAFISDSDEEEVLEDSEDEGSDVVSGSEDESD
ncbi:hypothetical protein RCL1_001191 [Eukaryota sp. TZLM3-RCL]